MKAKREVAKRRSGDRPGGRDASGSKSAQSVKAEAVSTRRARTARTTKSGPQTNPIARPVERPTRAKSTSQAKARAKARKAKAPKVIRPRLTERLAIRLASIDLRPHTLLSKVPFVVLVIGALGVGLALTLWLSTDSAERSYKLSDARERARVLQEQKESLERDVREAQSAPALAESARKEGMIPTRDTAHLVQDPSGNWVVVGTPKPADGVPPPPLNGPVPEPGPPPPPPAPAVPLEVPVRVQPGAGAPPPPATSGPEALLRAPDGSSTVGGQHLPQVAPRLPGASGLAPVPGLPVPGVTAPIAGPAEVPIPLGGLPVPVAVPPVPLAPGAASVHAPSPLPGAAAPPPGNGEQFGPVAVPAPGAAR